MPELRPLLSQNFSQSSEYDQVPGKFDYAHPDYYRQFEHAASPFPDAPSEQYRGPEGLEGYTTNVGDEQRAAANGDGSKERQGKVAGVSGMLAWLAIAAKFGFTGFTVLISVFVYAWISSWYFAIGLVLLLFVHEMGHAIVMKIKGIPVGGMIFIPMLGAAVLMRQSPQNARDEAEVGIAGPIAGSLAASVCLAVAELVPNAQPIWASLAYFGFFINLFNLIPIVPFDGGRILAAIDRRVWIIGFLGLLALQVWQWVQGNTSLWLLFFIVMAATQFWSRRGAANTPQGKDYYNVSLTSRIALSVLYFGLAGVLVLGMSISHALI